MFQGYDQTTVDFMWGIRFNNERDWFMAHKSDYTDHFLAPTKALADQVYDAIHAELPDEPLICKVSRIYRDARRLFGRGPYKDNLWFAVRSGEEDWQGRPTFWFEIGPDFYQYGLGFWAPGAAVLAQYRKYIDEHAEEFAKLVRRFNRQSEFVLEGESYARPKGDPGKLLYPWYQKKNIMLVHTVTPLDDRIFDPALADDVAKGLTELVPFYQFFAKVLASVPTEER